jgi:hypothetical protein
VTRAANDATAPALVTCPACNMRSIFLHFLEHADDIRMADGSVLIYPVDDNKNHAIVDFGILSIEHDLDSDTFTVREFGEAVLTDGPEGYSIDRSGSWIDALTVIRMMLDQKFGAITESDGNDSHTMH